MLLITLQHMKKRCPAPGLRSATQRIQPHCHHARLLSCNDHGHFFEDPGCSIFLVQDVHRCREVWLFVKSHPFFPDAHRLHHVSSLAWLDEHTLVTTSHDASVKEWTITY